MLICEGCKQIPYIEFLPGLSVKFICCKTSLINYKDTDKFIEKNYTLKCEVDSNCQMDSDVNYFAKKIICDKCMRQYNSKNFIKGDSIPITCLKHGSKYKFFDPKSHRLFCEYCPHPKSIENIEDYKKRFSCFGIEIIK